MLLWSTLASLGEWELTLGEGSKLWLEGDSSIHKYESDAQVIELDSVISAKADGTPLDPSALAQRGPGLGSVSRFVLVIPIDELKSPTKGLSRQMHNTMNYKEHPEIVFTMKDYKVAPNPVAPEKYQIAATGVLTLNGTDQTVTLEMTGVVQGDQVNVVGTTELLMSQYGIPPPTLFLGRIKTDDKVVIKWNMNLGLKSKERSVTTKL